jgi:hypothetical protein
MDGLCTAAVLPFGFCTYPKPGKSDGSRLVQFPHPTESAGDDTAIRSTVLSGFLLNGEDPYSSKFNPEQEWDDIPSI